MSDLHENGELFGLTIALVGAVLCVMGAFVPVLESSDKTLLGTEEINNSLAFVYIVGGLLVGVLTGTAFLSGRGGYAILGTVVAILVYISAILLAVSDQVLTSGRGTAIYLIGVGATMAAIGAAGAALFAPDYFRR